MIKENWSEIEYYRICDKISVGIVIQPAKYYIENGIPAFRSANIKENKIDENNLISISDYGNKVNKKSILLEGDIVTVRTGYPGTSAVISKQYSGSNCIDLLISRPKKNISSNYISYWFNSEYAKSQILRAQGGLAQQHLNVAECRLLTIPLPPTLAEQEAIAEVLSDTDALITSLETTIEKKKLLKQGAMQELLTGKRRLPGFGGMGGMKDTEVGRIPEDWEVKKLGEVGVFTKGQGVRKDESNSGDIPCIRYGEIYTKHKDYIKSFYSYISTTVAKTAKKIQSGDILFAGSGETKEDIGKCVAYINSFEAYAGGDIVILSPYKCNSMFLGYLLNTPYIQKQKASRGQGDAVVHISATQLSQIRIPIPPTLTEQEAIAMVHSEIDEEIEGLENKLEKTKGIKQGLMQVLLTGKVRLV
ncbi:restriction endonuclease subunit S [Leptospira bouyouniensis]|uniref:Restriction endonuclease subunit S n=1 Tax=Leptospira bouyouniensis TaxID=2484911 RepID=A0A7I0HPK3_9LEPT|nr:restriction endonuclease subunit S [Leptospira bouyouniensis]TGL04060.1 restriction endonuclease subunit S [Leptospira bouyouniensis]